MPTIGTAITALLREYRAEQRGSLSTARYAVRAWAAHEHLDLEHLTYGRLRDIAQGWPCADATRNRRLALLRRGWAILHREGVAGPPCVFPHFREDNVRQGFVEDDALARLLAALPPDHRDFIEWLATTGMRRGEAARLTWDMLRDGVLHIPARCTKQRRARTLPITGPLADLMARRQARANGPFIFQKNGRPLIDFRPAWKAATRAAGVPGLLVHDLRRSAVRRLHRAGVSPEVCMRISGHRTLSMFQRYRIIDDREVAEALTRAYPTGSQQSVR